ncbi:hypothetical protein BF49_4576 [Bradyrhizobium sp.]|nr:hypothetical protein BF49_4576 [Bradyrhizobium sp.]
MAALHPWEDVEGFVRSIGLVSVRARLHRGRKVIETILF